MSCSAYYLQKTGIDMYYIMNEESHNKDFSLFVSIE